ncbi:helix-turn-helix domain-containing protein [Paenibacillus doosanensis]|uniref:helix-turn-helix domain-containing protein n=1 Tax=Paenibacillus doosanensis TaxID=1229154 RepID=UPI00217F9869|nr:helix-turn-helix domain-containing protein [Paenibacillus doosanensis]MCS7461508.1 helix-turn-helix domain-containing protein [Paenibacillus doosanensis]
MIADSVELGRLPDVRMSFHLMGLHVRQVDSRWTYPSHEHPMYELHWMIEGDMQMDVEGQIYDQKKGDLLFIRPGVIHSCKSAGSHGFTYFCVHFSIADPAFSKELERHQATCYNAASPLVKELFPFLTDLCNLATENRSRPLSAAKSMKVYAAVFELLGTLVEQLLQTGNVVLTRKELLAGRIAENIEDSIRSSLLHGQMEDSERTLVQDIAESLKLSPSQVNRIFQQVYRKAPRQYMSEVLLREAQRLLLQTDLSVDHIAMLLGYKTSAHFSRQFKRWTAMTPSGYRSGAERECPNDR